MAEYRGMCPLRYIKTSIDSACVGSNCAWYDTYSDECGIAGISKNLRFVSDALDEIIIQDEEG